MRILHITQFLGVGGLEKLLLSLMLQQKKLGHEPTLLVYGDDQAWVEYFRSFGLTVLTDYRKKAGYDWGVAQFIKQHWQSYDVVHSHDINPAMYIAPLLYLGRLPFSRRPKWVHTAHGMDHLKQAPKTRYYERLFTTKADIIVGVAPHVCQTYLTKLGASEKQVKLVENGIIIPESFARQPEKPLLAQSLGFAPQGKVWMCVSRVVPLKDQGLILKVATSFPDDTFVLVGPSGDEQYWQQLKSSLPANVFMIGAHNEVSKLLMEADYFVSASHHEGIPLAVLEAGAHHLPCVLSDISGHKTLIKDEHEIALFFPVGDSAKLTTAIKTVMSDKVFADKLSERIHHTVLKYFSAEHMTDKYLQLYSQGTL